MFDRVPPGQQPQISTVTALMGSICKTLARQKAERGMMKNWASNAIATPLGLRMWALILEISMVQPSEIIVMKTMARLRKFMVMFMALKVVVLLMLLLPERPPSLSMRTLSMLLFIKFIVTDSQSFSLM